MYAGRIVESGNASTILDAPMHPYTHGLIGSVPSRNKRGDRLRQIPGMTPSLLSLPSGCAFRLRCVHADAVCEIEPPVETQPDGRDLRCYHPMETGA
jgi:peptide/nickel transport system ATP-binding protein